MDIYAVGKFATIAFLHLNAIIKLTAEHNRIDFSLGSSQTSCIFDD